MRALAYAAALGQPTFALHISPTVEGAERFRGYWKAWGDHLPLEVIVSPHRALVAPLVNYIWTLHQQRPDLTLTVAVPEIMARHWWHRILHDRIARRLRRTSRRTASDAPACREPATGPEHSALTHMGTRDGPFGRKDLGNPNGPWSTLR